MSCLRWPAVLLSTFLLWACRDANPGMDHYDLGYDGQAWPQAYISPDNALTAERIALGRQLFYDFRLSRDSSLNCASCHRQELAFADSLPISPGVDGRLGLRNTPSLANLVFVDRAHRDGGVRSIDLQAMNPIEDHNEMALPLPQLAQRLRQDAKLNKLAMQAYNRPIDNLSIVFGLASFVRSIVSYDSRYDQAIKGIVTFNQREQSGYVLFEEHCASCHKPPLFGSNDYANNGSHPTYNDKGRARVSGLEGDIGKFRIPSLRNVALTAPYMHDGSYPTLESVIDHYDQGGHGHPNQDQRIHPLHLSKDQQQDLLAFLETLTDTTLLTNSDYQESSSP